VRSAVFRAATAAGMLFVRLGLSGQTPEEPRARWSIAGGWGHTAQFVTADETNANLLLLAPQWTYRLSRVVEAVAEGHFAGYVGNADGWFLGVVPIGLRFHVADSSWRPYLGVHAGFGWTDLRIIELDRRFNFILEGGLGARPPSFGGRLSFEIRLVHYSNAGTVPPNYGLNTLALVGAWRFD
jgi:lipid A 3-O-deacylase PagL